MTNDLAVHLRVDAVDRPDGPALKSLLFRDGLAVNCARHDSGAAKAVLAAGLDRQRDLVTGPHRAASTVPRDDGAAQR